MNLLELLNKNYLNHQIDNKNFFFGCTLFIIESLLQFKIHTNKIYEENNILYVSIIENKKAVSLLTIEFTIKKNIITDISLNVNKNYLLIKNNPKLNNFLLQ